MEMYLNCPVIVELDEVDFYYFSGFNYYLSGAGYLFTNSLTEKYLHISVALRAGLNIENGIDHKDGNRLNCKRNNLRPATKSQNGANRGKPISGITSKYKGVSWDKINEKWRSDIKVNGIGRNLGRFDTEEEAYLTYCQAAKQYFGKFANIG